MRSYVNELSQRTGSHMFQHPHPIDKSPNRECATQNHMRKPVSEREKRKFKRGGGHSELGWDVNGRYFMQEPRDSVCVEFHRSFLFMRWPEKKLLGLGSEVWSPQLATRMRDIFFFFSDWGRGREREVN
jgi:hypothetical protein